MNIKWLNYKINSILSLLTYSLYNLCESKLNTFVSLLQTRDIQNNNETSIVRPGGLREMGHIFQPYNIFLNNPHPVPDSYYRCMYLCSVAGVRISGTTRLTYISRGLTQWQTFEYIDESGGSSICKASERDSWSCVTLGRGLNASPLDTAILCCVAARILQLLYFKLVIKLVQYILKVAYIS